MLCKIEKQEFRVPLGRNLDISSAGNFDAVALPDRFVAERNLAARDL